MAATAPATSASPASPSAAARSAGDEKGARSTGAPVEGEAAGVRYLEIVTKGADVGAELPLVMLIHGLGDRPENFAPLLGDLDEPVRLIVPRGLTPHSGGYSWFPLRGELASSEVEKGVRAAAQSLAGALSAIKASRPTRGRPIVTGFSQGGALSFALALLHPEAVSAAFPVGGWVAFPLPPKASAPAAPPIVALHGGTDGRIPIEGTRTSVNGLRELGYTVELREFPGVGHSVPEAMRRELAGLIAAAARGR